MAKVEHFPRVPLGGAWRRLHIDQHKRAYVAPTVTMIGTFEDITQGSSTGGVLDAVIPIGTPIIEILGIIANHQIS